MTSYTLSSSTQFEYIIKKSRFIGFAFPLFKQEDIKEHLRHIQKTYPTASHFCWGYQFQTRAQCNDDGEPSGTAGRPILQIILHKKIHNILIIVVRWFGGIKLGAGGLIRAYGATAGGTLKEAPLKKIIPTTHLTITCPLPIAGLLQSRCNYWNITFDKDPHYTAQKAIFQIQIATDKMAEIKEKIKNVTQGNAQFKEIN